jgi:hypothetical protein
VLDFAREIFVRLQIVSILFLPCTILVTEVAKKFSPFMELGRFAAVFTRVSP